MPASHSVEIAGVSGQCPICQHPPIRHVYDGTGYSCLVCIFEAEQAVAAAADAIINEQPYRAPNRICTLKFEFKLGLTEREQAAAADKGSYPPRTVCAECDGTWEAHQGYLCPTGDSTFVPLLDKDVPFIRVN